MVSGDSDKPGEGNPMKSKTNGIKIFFMCYSPLTRADDNVPGRDKLSQKWSLRSEPL
jgi:hypothetical protein